MWKWMNWNVSGHFVTSCVILSVFLFCFFGFFLQCLQGDRVGFRLIIFSTISCICCIVCLFFHGEMIHICLLRVIHTAKILISSICFDVWLNKAVNIFNVYNQFWQTAGVLLLSLLYLPLGLSYFNVNGQCWSLSDIIHICWRLL